MEKLVVIFKADGEELESLDMGQPKRGKAAGPIRNRQMLDEKPNIVIAFHNDLSRSKGTRDTITEARKRGIKVIIVNEEQTIDTLHLSR